MPLTVRQLLEIPELSRMNLICGASGLDRQITSVNVMEAPDIAQWLHGGEFLLSTGYQFRYHPDSFDEIVVAIHKAGAAGLGFKNRFLHEFPTHAKDLANSLGLPILGLPAELAYSDIIRIIILKTDEVENIRFSESVLRSFSQSVAEGGDIAKILQNLMYFLKCNVCFLDAFSGHCICVSDSGFSDVPLARDKKVLLSRYAHERLTMSGVTYGYFLFEHYPSESLWRVVLEHAKTAMLLTIQRDIATKQVESRYRDEFIQDLVTNNIRYHEEVLNRAKRFGWDLSGPLRCVICDIDGYKRYFEDPLPDSKVKELEEARQRIYALCKQEMRHFFKDIPYSTMSDSIVFLLGPGKYNETKDKLRKCYEEIRKKIFAWTSFTVTIGVGEEKKNFFGCSESYEEARKAIEMMRPSKGGNALYFWEDLGILTILANIRDSLETRRFCEARLARLFEENGKKHGELIDTLYALTTNNWNLKATARALAVHYNTLRYRYERLCKLTGLNLAEGEERLEIEVALKLITLNPALINNTDYARD